MSAGRRRSRIVFQRAVTSQDAYGEEIQTWGDIAEQWAAVFYGKGDERRQAAMEQGQQAATFQVLSNAATRTVTLEDRLIHAGFIWDIVGISPDVPKRGMIEFTATATGEQDDVS